METCRNRFNKRNFNNPKETYTKSLVSSVPPTNKKISRFIIVEKENQLNKNTISKF